MSEQAASDVRVLDLTWYIAGPYCTKLLADYGADVVKVERPDRGDPARNMGPFLGDDPDREKSGLFLYLNTNKKGITLNLKTAAGVKLFKELAREADAVVESFSPGTMAELGLDYETLEKVNPRLVMTSISNYGQSGPYRDYKATELIEQASAGHLYATGQPDREPVRTGAYISCYQAGLFAAIGTLSALWCRDDTGLGQHVDVSIMEVVNNLTTYPPTIKSYTGSLRPDFYLRTGKTSSLGIVPCQDGYVVANLYSVREWEGFLAILGMPEMMEVFLKDKIFSPNTYTEWISERVLPWFAERTTDEVFHQAQGVHVAVGPVLTMQQVIEFPQYQAREFLLEIEHPRTGRLFYPGAPFKMAGSPWQVRSPAPLLGEHNKEIYCDHLGYSSQDLVKLRDRGTI